MTCMTEKQRFLVRGMKGLGPSQATRDLVVRRENGVPVGSLQPISQDLANNWAIAEMHTRWRKTYMHYFLTEFEATPERTTSWLNEVVLPDDTRILFLIRDGETNAVGNFGVCSITHHEAELDNLIRGEKGGPPDLIYLSELALMQWLFNEVEVEEIVLHVFTDNARTRKLHSAVGFQSFRIGVLNRTEDESGVRHTVDYQRAPVGEDRGYLEMRMDRRQFRERHHHIAHASSVVHGVSERP